jgi:hypothetical protein
MHVSPAPAGTSQKKKKPPILQNIRRNQRLFAEMYRFYRNIVVNCYCREGGVNSERRVAHERNGNDFVTYACDCGDFSGVKPKEITASY